MERNKKETRVEEKQRNQSHLSLQSVSRKAAWGRGRGWGRGSQVPGVALLIVGWLRMAVGAGRINDSQPGSAYLSAKIVWQPLLTVPRMCMCRY